jgi:hypothetical protein
MANNTIFSRNEAIKLGREDTKCFLEGQTHALWSAMSAKMKEALQTEDALEAIAKQVIAQFGPITDTLQEDAMPDPSGMMTYTRVVKFDAFPMPMVISFTFSPPDSHTRGSIEGFYIRPQANPATSSFLNYKDKATIHFPLKGEWAVYQGGRTTSENYHAITPDERFAYDFVVIKNDSLYSGDGSSNDDWFSFRQPVLAGASGKVVSAFG